TIGAASKLIEQAGAVVVELAFVIELAFLGGREKLTPYSIYSLIQY
ncbi:MAG: adenine phosphoribosyltransferase, partial [Chloroflexales bacterium]